MAQTIVLPASVNVSPSNAKTATTDNYISSVNYHKDDIYEVLTARYGNQRIADDFQVIFGNVMAPAAQTTYSHWEENFIHEMGTAQAATAPSSGTSEVLFTVAAGYLDANGSTVLRAGDIILFAKNKQQCLVSATSAAAISGSTVTSNADDVKLIPYNAWSFTATADDAVEFTFSVIGRENVEGGDTPSEYLTPTRFEYTNNVTIIDEAYAATGSEMTNQVWTLVQGVGGKQGYVWHYKGELDTRNRFENYREIIGMVGKKATGTLASRGYRGTRGYLTDLETYAPSFQDNFSTNAPTVADLRLMAKNINRYRGAKKNAFYAGIDLYNIIETEIAQTIGFYAGNDSGTPVKGGSNYGSITNSATDNFVNLGFNRFQVSNHEFYMKAYDLFNHPKLLGASAAVGGAMNYSYWGMVMPMTVVPDAKSNELLPSLRVRYKEMEGYSREMEHWLTGAVNGVYTNKTDKLEFNYRSEIGYEGVALNRHFLWKHTA